jgi:hypothetical protein
VVFKDERCSLSLNPLHIRSIETVAGPEEEKPAPYTASSHTQET